MGSGNAGIARSAAIADPAGALYWPEQQLLVVADLHLEKGSSFARRGLLLPPYDSAVTLHNLGRLLARYAPQRVIALGDSFHDRDGGNRMGSHDRDTLASLQRGRDSFYPAMGGGCLITLLLLSFNNVGLLGTATSLIAAAIIGLGIAQSKSRTTKI